MDEFITPPYLKKGDKIALLAPAGSFTNPTALELTIRWVKENGWEPQVYPQTFEKFGSLAGNDSTRLKTFQSALDDPDVRAIWAVRGGYGSIRIIDKLHFERFLKNPKWIMGFSDISLFLLKTFELNVKAIHSPMPVQFEKLPSGVLLKTAGTLKGELPAYQVKRDSMNRNEANTSGILIGGNAATILSYTTSCSINFKNKILFLEDIGENLYALDRIFQSFRHAGIFHQIKALILGHFTGIRQDDPPFPYSVKQIVLTAVEDTGIPVFFNFPAGHEPKNFPFISGQFYQIKIEDRYWHFIPKEAKK